MKTKHTQQVQRPQLHGNGSADSAYRSALRPGNPKGLESQNFPGCNGSLKDSGSLSCTLAPSERGGGRSVVRAPVAGVAGRQAAGDEQDEVHEPPDAQAPQGQQLPHRRARVAQAEAVHPEAAQEEGVEQRGDEVVPRVPARKRARRREKGRSTFLQNANTAL